MPRHFDSRVFASSRDHQVQLNHWFEMQIEGMSDSLSVMVQSVELPELTANTVEVPIGNTTAKVAGKIEFGDTSLTVRDAIILDNEWEFLEWYGKVYDPETGKMGWVDEYKKDMLVTQYGPDGTYERAWKYEGCWPLSLTFGEMDYSGADVKTISVTLAYDRAYRVTK